ncbi:MAG: hypothetical protein M1820_006884 [Bogoriella megaspora]|nr:MAG: hypothetical protein M1820_006884 [Bogoriella megaspora]
MLLTKLNLIQADPSWNDPKCPSFCVSPENKDTWNNAMGLNQCSSSDLDEYYCVDAATETMSPAEACADKAVTFTGEYFYDTKASLLTLNRDSNYDDYYWRYNINVLVHNEIELFVNDDNINHFHCIIAIIITTADCDVVIVVVVVVSSSELDFFTQFRVK